MKTPSEKPKLKSWLPFLILGALMPIIPLAMNDIYDLEIDDGVLGVAGAIAFLIVGFVARKPLAAADQAYRKTESTPRLEIINLISITVLMVLSLMALAADVGAITNPLALTEDGGRYLGVSLACFAVVLPFMAFSPTPFAMFQKGADERDQENLLRARDIGQRVLIVVGLLGMCCDYYGYTEWPAAFWVGITLASGIWSKQAATAWIEIRS